MCKYFRGFYFMILTQKNNQKIKKMIKSVDRRQKEVYNINTKNERGKEKMTYTLKVQIDPTGYTEYLEKIFKHAYKLKRELVNYYNRQEYRRRNSDDYKYLAEETKLLKELQEKIKETKDKELQKALKSEYKERADELKKGWIALNNAFGLGSGKFIHYKHLGQASVMYERYAKDGIINATSFELMAQATKQGYLKRRSQSDSDNFMRVPKASEFTTIWYRKCNANISMDGISFGKHSNKIKLPWSFKNDDEIRLSYAMEMQKLALYAVKRVLQKDNTWKYYALMVFDGVPYGTRDCLPTKGKVVISLDVDKLEIVARNESINKELRFDLSNDLGYSDKLSRLDTKIENSRRLNNPENYEENGVIKKGVHVWKKSNNYIKLLNKKRYLWHKIKSYRKNRFEKIVNDILELGDEFVVYKEDFKTLQQRKDFDKETMSWFDTRKQRGFEIMFNAPYEFLMLLNMRLSYFGKVTETIVKGESSKRT